ncbi:hypothetical protein EXIGLDRAFT_776138 [Exidia glandulosa HHB12029]|uniref:Uncharacterized protein n=1 Tax=Exidia glandulosa HHB12029 TaxID=1314781 RepID=A0A165DLC9_EXIGL|nr:hypothetical protein EXIGLDRAFT_776138 [Exidia glandulosa HHB12029]
MVPPDQVTLDMILRVLTPGFLEDVASLVIDSVLYGVYVVLFTVSLYSISRKFSQQRITTLIALSATLAMFGSSTYMWATRAVVCARYYDFRVVRNDTGVWALPSELSTARADDVRAGMFMFSFIIGDGVLAWRTSVLSSRNKPVTFICTVIWLAMFCSALSAIVIAAKFKLGKDDLTGTLIDAGWCISLALNILCTTLLGPYKPRSHSRATKTLAGHGGPTSAARTLGVLVIAGLLYVLLSLPRIILIVLNYGIPPDARIAPALEYAAMIGNEVPNQLVGLFPTTVTALIFWESTVFEPSVPSIESAGTVSIRFASTRGDGRMRNASFDTEES